MLKVQSSYDRSRSRLKVRVSRSAHNVFPRESAGLCAKKGRGTGEGERKLMNYDYAPSCLY